MNSRACYPSKECEVLLKKYVSGEIKTLDEVREVYGFSQRCTDFNKIHLKAFNNQCFRKEKGIELLTFDPFSYNLYLAFFAMMPDPKQVTS